MFIQSNSLENDSLLTQIPEKYRSNMRRFDPDEENDAV